MKYEVGSTVEGKVTGIKPFGAFVALDDQHQGLVHISEVSHDYVKDINDHLSVGATVEVKIMNIEENSGKISLSIRKTQAAPEPKQQPAPRPRRKRPAQNDNAQGFNTLEEKLKLWLKESNERQAQINKRLKK
ncbi:S1 domain-containing post-transcriptional regulator GSP13 [Pseudalkalibacillus decolorationis]|uniref:S1 domain-containing post-transcriptional regulator GSP13 n=1 Tax=Pseudalkalibacillus decolorationis TaxID=163879 RepID=UPI0021474470|nr:S1 domain-containing post-transcriptional regulator GSP13 [Pseudalkalibacillus decolorationis]